MKISFSGFWPTFKPQEWRMWEILRKRWPDLDVDDHAPLIRFSSVFGAPATVRHAPVEINYTAEPGPQPDGFDLYIGFDRDESETKYRLPNYVLHAEAEEAAASRDASPAWSVRCGVDWIYRNATKSSPRIGVARYLVAHGFHLLAAGAAAAAVTDTPHDCPGRFCGMREGKRYIQQRTRWSVAMENCSQPGYVTEKLLHALIHGTVPIYWGDPHPELDFDQRAFIHLRGQSLEELVEELTEERWHAARRAPMFPGGTPPPCWDHDRFLDWLESGIDRLA